MERQEQLNIYDQKQYEARLLFRDKTEEELWRSIERADAAIIKVLKRINLIFGKVIETADTCSGHIKEDDTIANDRGIVSNEVFHNPHIIFKVKDEKSFLETRNVVRDILIKAVNEVNQKFQKEALKYGKLWPKDGKWHEEWADDFGGHTLYYDVTVTKPKEKGNFDILKAFWESVESELEQLDHIPYRSVFEREMFIK